MSVDEISEEFIKAHCPHCDPQAEAFKYLLEETDNFFVVCDAHPIVEGHILIIPKAHLSCIGEYPEAKYQEFIQIYKKISDFLQANYGKVSTFEHGKFGQTVFHSHVHLMPFKGQPIKVIPEGLDKLEKLNDLAELKGKFEKDGGYLFFSIGNKMWTVDPDLTAPRFFRDRFAKALSRPERGNWKQMHQEEGINPEPDQEDKRTQKKWSEYKSKQP